MGLKATITALINSNIRNKTPKVVKIEHADVEQSIVDYGWIRILDSNTLQQYVTYTATPGITFNLCFTKSLGMVSINGTIANTGAFIGGGNNTVFNWRTLVGGLDNELIPADGWVVTGVAFNTNIIDHTIHLILDGTRLRTRNGMDASSTYEFSVSPYKAKY